MIDRTHALPVSRQAKLVGIARSSVYYQARPVNDRDLMLMRRIDVNVGLKLTHFPAFRSE